MSGKGQSVINRLIGATTDEPLELPIKIPPIELEKETMKTMGYYLLGTGGLLGLGIVLGALIKS